MKKILSITIAGLCLAIQAEAQTSFLRRSVVEELTGTRCGWCPRGLAGMEKLRQTFGERFIGIAVHNYDTNDPMYYRPYAANGVFSSSPGAPTCTIDRSDFCDPLHGATGDVCHDFQYMLDQPAWIGVTVSGTYNADSTVVEATAHIEAGRQTEGLTVVYVLVADSVASDQTDFRQYNGYATRQPADYPNDPELHRFCTGGEYGVSPFRWAFDDVCIGSSYSSQGTNLSTYVGTLAEGQQTDHSHRLTMPTKAVLRRAIDKRRVSIVAMVLDADGHVMNADKRLVGQQPDTQAIRLQQVDGRQAAAPYDLQGRRVSLSDNRLPHGIYISQGRKLLR
ncbi:MAG: hypothetical protein IJ200_03955 [Prevotella sp.]|nr:hypothetical protein [Prevotella sp.]